VAPGEGFGARGAGWVRLSLALPDAEVALGAERVALSVAEALSARARAAPSP
jgi:aspartate/methionine/tyrosine aminotransferase